MTEQPCRIVVGDSRTVSGLFLAPSGPRACCVVAHGAGAGMAHPFLAAVASGLAARDIATLRFQFPYMEEGGRRPDPPPVARAAVRGAVAEAARLAPGLPLFAGGKSFGGRMTSAAQAETPLAGVRGLFFLGFPLHPAGRPGTARAAHLSAVAVPMLFLQGTRDQLAEVSLVRDVLGGLGSRATLNLFEDADHSFHVPARTGRTDADLRRDVLDALARWIDLRIAGAVAS